MNLVLAVVAFAGWSAAVAALLLALGYRKERNEWETRAEYFRRSLKNMNRQLRQRRGLEPSSWSGEWASDPTLVDPTPRD